MNIWRVLGLEPTRDVAVIRRAYAAAAKRYHPEEQPEEFQRVRSAYEQALAYARTAPRVPGYDREDAPPPANRYSGIENKTPPKKGVATGGTYMGPARRPPRPDLSEGRRPRAEIHVREMAGSGGPEPDWLREETAEGQAELFRRSPAMEDFRELWRQEKKRGDKKAWREYFSSPVFLEAQREEGFTAALLEFVEGAVKNGEALPQKFLLELAIAYGIRYQGKTTVCLSYAAFAGVESIRSILLMGHPLDRLSHEEDKIWAACWRDYFELLSLAKTGGFENTGGAGRTCRWKELIDRYRREKITARPEVTRKREEDVELRHPYGLRLLAALVKNHPLPTGAVQYLYDSLQLERMASGSAKKDYKPLLEAVLPVLPDQERVRKEKAVLATVKKAVEAFLQSYGRRSPFPHTDVLPAYDAAPSPEEEKAARMLVESAAFRQFLFTGRLEETGVMDKIFSTPTALIGVLAQKMRERGDDPAARAILARCLEKECKWALDPVYFFDRPYDFSGADPGEISLDNREFWHYYLSTAFSAAFSTDNEEFIGTIIGEQYHPSLWWRRRFTGFDEAAQRILSPKSREFSLGEHRVDVEFHLRYQLFRVDGEEVPERFPWEELLSLAGSDDLLFWLALPLAVGRDDERPAIRREVQSRLGALAVYDICAGRITDCLVNHVVTSRKETPAALRALREDGQILYGYEVANDRTLKVYWVNGIIRRREKEWDRRFSTVEAAAEAAEKYLGTVLTPPRRLLRQLRVAGAIPQHKAKALVDCLGEAPYTEEDRRRDGEITPALATDDFLDYGARRHGSYTADFYQRYLHRPYWAGLRFGSQEGERFLLKVTLEIWPYGSEKAKQERRGELLTQMGMLGEAAYFVGCIHWGKTRYTLISSSQRRMLFAVREGTSHYHSGWDLPSLLTGMLTRDEWEAVEFAERYEDQTSS